MVIMKLFSFFVSLAFLLTVSELLAQTDSTTFKHGLPVDEDDTVAVFPQTDLFPPENVVLLSPSQIPKKVKKALQKGDQYSGWERGAVYLDKNTNLFLVEIKQGNSSRIFGLDDSGRPVTYDEVSRNDDQDDQ